MKFTFDEKELVDFVKHVNSVMEIGARIEVVPFKDHSVVTQAVGDAIKERIVSKAQDYIKR